MAKVKIPYIMSKLQNCKTAKLSKFAKLSKLAKLPKLVKLLKLAKLLKLVKPLYNFIYSFGITNSNILYEFWHSFDIHSNFFTANNNFLFFFNLNSYQ